MKITIIGTYPPPYGGISIHVKRMYENLKKNNIEVRVYSPSREKLFNDNIINMRYKKLLLYFLIADKKTIYHSNLTGFIGKIFFGYYSFFLRKKFIISVHGGGLTESYNSLNCILKLLYKFSLQHINHIIVVNPDIKKECLALGIKEENISVIPAYINPIINEEDYKKIDSDVWKFIDDSKKLGNKIITGNGNIRFFNNEDLYGLDLLIDLIHELKKENYKVSLLFALLGYEDQNDKERKYYEELLERIKKYKIEDSIYLYKIKDTEYYPILEKADVFIRPTNTDGDAISLREAIYFRKPNISSDIVVRPEGSIVFETRNLKYLVAKTKNVLDNYESETKKLEKIEVKEYYQDVLDVYKKVEKGR